MIEQCKCIQISGSCPRQEKVSNSSLERENIFLHPGFHLKLLLFGNLLESLVAFRDLFSRGALFLKVELLILLSLPLLFGEHGVNPLLTLEVLHEANFVLDKSSELVLQVLQLGLSISLICVDLEAFDDSFHQIRTYDLQHHAHSSNRTDFEYFP